MGSMNFPYTAYCVTEVFLFIFALTILLRINNNIAPQKEARELRLMIGSYMVMLLSDIVSMTFEDDVLRAPTWLVATINALTIISISLSAYFWLRYVEVRLCPRLAGKRWVTLLFLLPLAFIVVADIVSIFNGWLFYIDQAGHYQSRSVFVFVQGSVNYFYALLPALYALYLALKTRSRLQREECLIYTGYMLVIVLATLFEDVFPYAPILALANFLIIEIIFLMIQNMQIYNDALTNLNNRRHLTEYLEKILPEASSEHPVHFLLLDLNGLKRINDRYGHVEGDRSLKLVARALRKVASEHQGFAARYGGDEFVLVGNQPAPDGAVLAKEVQEALAQFQTEAKESLRPYRVSVSIGYVSATSSTSDVDKLIEEADQKLYAEKELWHQTRHDA